MLAFSFVICLRHSKQIWVKCSQKRGTDHRKNFKCFFYLQSSGLGREKVTYLFHLPMNIKNHLLGILFEQEFHSVHAV